MPSRGVLLQYVTAVSITTAEGTVNLLYSPLLSSYGYALTAIGTLAALFAVLQLASRVPIGASYRSSAARRQLATWLLVFGATIVGIALFGSVPAALIAFTVAHGFAFGALGTINLAITIDHASGQRSAAVMGWYTAFISVGYALGNFGGGWAADTFGIAQALVLGGAIPLVAIICALLLPHVADAPHANPRGPGLRGLLGAYATLDPRVWLAFVIALFLNLMSDTVEVFYPLFGLGIGLPLAATGALKGIRSGSSSFIRFVSGGLFRYLDHRTVNFWAVLVFGVSNILLPLFTTFGLLVPLFVGAGLARGILRVTSATMIAELREEGKDVGIASGVYSAGLDVGSIVGPATGGVIATAFGIGPMFQIMTVVSLAVYFGVAFATPTGRATLSLRLPQLGRSRAT